MIFRHFPFSAFSFDMQLAIDIGNSKTKFGLFEGQGLIKKISVDTNRRTTSPEIFKNLNHAFPDRLDGIVISSVVAENDDEYRKFGLEYYKKEPVFVDHTFDFGFSINYFPSSDCGSDRLVDAYAAVAKYGAPCVVCDFGTATTIDFVSEKLEYLGGIISPGINTLASALFEKTSKLPQIEIEKPNEILGNSTRGSIQSGIYYGYIGMVDGIIERITNVYGKQAAVISTGGFAELIEGESEFVKIVEPNLLLEGLNGLIQRMKY